MSVITNLLAPVLQVQKVPDQADSLNAKVALLNGQSEGSYLAFVSLKDITEGRGDGWHDCAYACPRPRPEPKCKYMCPDPDDRPWRPDRPDRPWRPDRPDRPDRPEPRPTKK